MEPIPGYALDEGSLILDRSGALPLIYWPGAPNFGDLLSPWLFEKLTGHKVSHFRGGVVPLRHSRRIWRKLTEPKAAKLPHYIGIGSIMSRVRDNSVVWGTGAFGTEQFYQLNGRAKYHAVRGPLSRQLLLNVGVRVGEIYGDPALLTPYFFDAPEEKTNEIGVVLRWSEDEWLRSSAGDGVKIISLGSDDVEGTLLQMLSCKRIITSSLHGLIIADAYGIPNAFLASTTPKGGVFKYLDYFASVDKFRKPVSFDFVTEPLEVENLESRFVFDDREIDFDADVLLEACPFLKSKSTRSLAT